MQQLVKLKDEYDQLLEQFQAKQYEGMKLQKQYDETSSNISIVTDNATIAKQFKNIQILEKELEVMREENEMLHKANEKLVQKFVH